MEHKITKEDLEMNKELIENNIKEGEIVEIKDAQIVEETKEKPVDTDLHINLSTPNFGTTIISIKEKDVPKLARAFYEFCIDNKIDATITNK